MSKFKTLIIVAALAAISGATYIYFKSSDKSTGEGASAKTGNAAGAAQNRPVSVSTIIAQKRDYDVKITANGVVSPLNTVDIRPQVTSTIAKVHIKEGQFVKTGEVLFTLDSRADEVNLAKAQAQLDKDLATLADNQRQLVRSKDLFAKKFVAQSAVDTSQTLVDTQQAVIASDKAAVNAARVALSYNRIVAPSAGRTGIISVFPGSLVQPNATAVPMVSITQMDPVTITFPLPQRNLPDALESLRRSDSYVMANLPDTTIKFKGKLQFVDNAVDAASGTIKVKAVFDNKELKLWPGAYANLELSVQTLKDVVVVPQDAVIVGPRGKSVYIVDEEGKAVMKPVVVTNSFGTDAVVTGIAAGAKVVLDGKQNLRPGATVKERNGDGKEGKEGKGGKEDPAAKGTDKAGASSSSAASATASAASSSSSAASAASAS
ncbi:efflux RND transporter periplasmic adaptor subunit [Undibacterium sp. Di27W]|uniref:efflux RND transporter periplasmic adaptor subunit n=1 Tax=Undibacterium sp. Di27W TaxID=3413036 RepID=UPI003BF0DCBD